VEAAQEYAHHRSVRIGHLVLCDDNACAAAQGTQARSEREKVSDDPREGLVNPTLPTEGLPNPTFARDGIGFYSKTTKPEPIAHNESAAPVYVEKWCCGHMTGAELTSYCNDLKLRFISCSYVQYRDEFLYYFQRG
jgi:hypothetical protein